MIHAARTTSLAAVLCGLAVAPALAGEPWELGFDGFGPVQVGMSERGAASALGTPLVLTGITTDSECYFVQPKGGPAGLTFLIADGGVRRVDVSSDAVATGEGARVGLTEAAVRALLGERIETAEPAAGTASWAAVPAYGASSPYRMVFWPDGGRVARISSGEAAWASADRPCR